MGMGQGSFATWSTSPDLVFLLLSIFVRLCRISFGWLAEDPRLQDLLRQSHMHRFACKVIISGVSMLDARLISSLHRSATSYLSNGCCASESEPTPQVLKSSDLECDVNCTQAEAPRAYQAWLTLTSSASSCDFWLAGGRPVQAAAAPQLLFCPCRTLDPASGIIYVKSHGQPKSKKALRCGLAD